MEIDEIVRRLEKIAPYGTHYPGEPLFVLSLDDGIALKEAIELLKKQKPVKPKEYMSRVNRTEYLCGACDSGILYGDEFCRHCGRQVKWDD